MQKQLKREFQRGPPSKVAIVRRIRDKFRADRTVQDVHNNRSRTQPAFGSFIPKDFFYGTLEHQVHSTKPRSIDELKAIIEREYAQISIEIISVFLIPLLRVISCLDSNGQ